MTGAVTFLFTDIEGSAQRWERRHEAMASVLARHDAVMRAAIAARGGRVFKAVGDGFCAIFTDAADAVAAALDAQRRLLTEDFSAVDGLRVRMAICTGTAENREGDYFGPTVNRVARLLAAASGGQVLLSHTTGSLVMSSAVTLRDLGEHRLKGLAEAEHIFQLVAEGLPRDFPPLRSLDSDEIRAASSFVGRDNELAALGAALNGGHTIAAIHGLGGTGKSSLAREYAWRNRDQYAVTWWLNADTESGIVDGLLRLGALFLEGLNQLADRYAAAQQVVQSTLTSFDKPVLLIFDNLEDERLLRTWLPRSGSRALVTSRNAAWGADVILIPLGIWPLEIATSYLRREAARTDLTEGDARAIAEALGALPLALAHAAASLRGMRMVTPSQYLGRISRQLKSAPRGAEYPRSVFATFCTAITQAEQEAAGAAAALCFAASFAPDAIPDELFRQPVDCYPARLQIALSDDPSVLDLRGTLVDGVRLDEALGALDRLSLLTFSETSRTYRIHRLVQLAARDMVDDAPAWQRCAVGAVDAAFPEVESGNVEFAKWPLCERFLPHAREALDVLPEDEAILAAGRLADRCAVYLRERGNYGEAEPLQTRALAIGEKALGPAHPSVATSLNHLAHLYWRQGRYEAAEPLYGRALAIQEKALGPDHRDVATSLNDMAQLYYDRGRFAEAEPLYKRALAIREKSFGPDHRDVVDALTNLAVLYARQGHYEEVEPLLTRALAVEEKALGENHPSVGSACCNLGVLYTHQRRYEEAEPLLTRALAIWEEALGPDHPDVALCLNNLAEVHERQGRYSEAEALHMRALAIRKEALGSDHPDVAISLDNLAKVYESQKRYDDAEPLLTRALAIFEKSFGRDHPDVATCLTYLADLYEAQKRSEDAAPLYTRALAIREAVLGPDHPFTKTVREKLSSRGSRGGVA